MPRHNFNCDDTHFLNRRINTGDTIVVTGKTWAMLELIGDDITIIKENEGLLYIRGPIGEGVKIRAKVGDVYLEGFIPVKNISGSGGFYMGVASSSVNVPAIANACVGKAMVTKGSLFDVGHESDLFLLAEINHQIGYRTSCDDTHVIKNIKSDVKILITGKTWAIIEGPVGPVATIIKSNEGPLFIMGSIGKGTQIKVIGAGDVFINHYPSMQNVHITGSGTVYAMSPAIAATHASLFRPVPMEASRLNASVGEEMKSEVISGTSNIGNSIRLFKPAPPLKPRPPSPETFRPKAAVAEESAEAITGLGMLHG